MRAAPKPRPADLDTFRDIAESVGATVEIGTKQMGEGYLVPMVTLTLDGQTAEITQPTYRQCFARGQDWLNWMTT